MTAVATQQMIAASITPAGRYSTVMAEPGDKWQMWEVKDATAESTFSHGQGTGANTGNRSKGNVWDEWED